MNLGRARSDLAYHVPHSLEDALACLQHGPARVIAGCTDYYPSQPPGAVSEDLVDITRVSELKGIKRLEDGWQIGAATTWTDLIRADLPSCFDGLKQAARTVGSVQIQNAASLVGNTCNASPAADGVPVLLSLNAEVEITSQAGRRLVALTDFVLGPRKVALSRGELVTGLKIPSFSTNTVSAFEKLGSRKYLVISIAMASVVLGKGTAGQIEFANVAVGACSPVSARQPRLERYLIGKTVVEISISPEMFEGLSPIDDVRGSARYRSDAICALVQRAIGRALTS